MLATLGVTGSYSIRINKPDGSQSNTLGFTVVPLQTTSITSTSPATPSKRDGDQTITVFGSGFQSNLSVMATVPGSGIQITLSGAQIQNVTPSSFQLIITLNVVGLYVIQVKNPYGSH